MTLLGRRLALYKTTRALFITAITFFMGLAFTTHHRQFALAPQVMLGVLPHSPNH